MAGAPPPVKPESRAGQHAGTPARRELILTAASRCFSRKGYDATTIEDVVAESGASIGSIYHHFGDKSGIAAAVYELAVRSYQEDAAPHVENAKSTEQAIRVGVIHYLTWMEENENLARFMLSGRHADVPANDTIHELIADFLRRISEWLVAAQERGELRPMAPDVAVSLWNGPPREYARAWLARSSGRRPTEVAEELAEGAWRALRP
jgi:AcrR family transcriptional regulator